MSCLDVNSSSCSIMFLLLVYCLAPLFIPQVHADPIRVAGYNAPPSMIITENGDGNVTYSGVDKDIIDELFKRLHLAYYIVNVRDSDKNGAVKQLIQQVLDNEVDICTYGFVPTPERVKLMDFSNVVEIDDYRFLLRYPEPENRLLGPIRPFQSTVWGLFIVAIILIVIFISILMLFHQKTRIEVINSERTLADHVSNNALYVVTVIASQGEYIPNRRLSIRLVVSVWCLMAVVLVNAYTGNLMSYLTVPKLNPIPNSFNELATSSDYKLAILANSVLMKTIMAATTEPYKKFGDFLRKNPDYGITSLPQLFSYILYHQGAAPFVSLVTNFALGEDMKSSGKCRLTVSKRLLMAQSTSYIFPKSTPFIIQEAINIQLERFWEYGLLEKIRTKYRPNIDRCLLGTVKPKMAILNLKDLSSAFVIWGIGLGIAILFFVLENILRCRNFHPTSCSQCLNRK